MTDVMIEDIFNKYSRHNVKIEYLESLGFVFYEIEDKKSKPFGWDLDGLKLTYEIIIKTRLEDLQRLIQRRLQVMSTPKITKEQLTEECWKVVCENHGKIRKKDLAEIANRYGMASSSVENYYYNWTIKDEIKARLKKNKDSCAIEKAVKEVQKPEIDDINIQAEDTAPIPDSDCIKLIGKKHNAPISFYIASKLENREQVRATARILGWYGWKWTFDWTSVSQEDSDRLPELLTEGVLSSDIVIVLLPGEFGTFTELGIALGSGKKIYLCSESDKEFTFGDKVCPFPLHPNITRVTGLPMDVIERVLSDYGLIKVGESA